MHKRFFLVVLCYSVVISMVATSCAEMQDKSGAKATVESGEASKIKEADKAVFAFFEALEAGEFDRARVYAAFETKLMLGVLVEDNKKYKEEKIKSVDVAIEVIDKKFEDNKGTYDIKVKTDGKSREGRVQVVLYQHEWLVVVGDEQLSLLRNVVFHNQYDQIVSRHINKPGEIAEIREKNEEAAEEYNYEHHRDKGEEE